MSCIELKLRRNLIVSSIPNQCKPRSSSMLLHPKIQHSLRVQRLQSQRIKANSKNLAPNAHCMQWQKYYYLELLAPYYLPLQQKAHIYTALLTYFVPKIHHGVAQMQRQLVKERGSRNLNPSKRRADLFSSYRVCVFSSFCNHLCLPRVKLQVDAGGGLEGDSRSCPQGVTDRMLALIQCDSELLEKA